MLTKYLHLFCAITAIPLMMCTTLSAEPITIVTWNAFVAPEGAAERTNDFKKLKEDYGPDIALIQEVKTHTEAKSIASGLGLTHVASSDFSQRHQDRWFNRLEVALLSKYPFGEKREYDITKDGKPTMFKEHEVADSSNIDGIERTLPKRGFIAIDIPAIDTTVIVVHLKSSSRAQGARDFENARKREYVAAAVMKVVTEIKAAHPARKIIVGGDFNVGERDQTKIGTSLTDDTNDGYDDTHHIMKGGIAGTTKLKSITYMLENTYDSNDFGNTGPIDCLYVSDELAADYISERAHKTYGSDHFPVIAMIESGQITQPAPDNAVDTNKSSGATSELKVIAWNVESNGNDPASIAQTIAEVQDCAIWGLSEVSPGNAGLYLTAAKEGENAAFAKIVGTTGGSDSLAILYNKNRLELLDTFELHTINPNRRVRSPLVARFKGKTTGITFNFMVNHLYRSNASARHDQARKLNHWATNQTIPTISVGDFNFDWDIPSEGADRDRGFDNMIAGDTFKWIKPTELFTTQANPNYNSVLDFIFVAGSTPDVSAHSRIIREGAGIFTERGRDTRQTSDHRPVEAIFSFKTPRTPTVVTETAADESVITTPANHRDATIQALKTRIANMEAELAKVKQSLSALEAQ